MRWVSGLFTLALLLWVTAAAAAVPQTISYQGILRDSGGTIVADGNYNLSFRIYNVASGGSALWTEAQTLAVQDGVFNALLGSVTALALDFNSPYWLGVTIAANPELTPRIALAAAPYGLNADRLDGLSSGDFAASVHSHSLDALTDVSVPAPTSGQVLTFNGANWDAQTPVAGGDDWDNSGGNIYRPSGKVGIGTVPAKPANPDEGTAQRLGRDANYSKLQIYSYTPDAEGGLLAQLFDNDNNSDARAAIYGLRSSGLSNPGSGFAPYQTNNAITGFNIWGDSYSFGVAGYSYFDTPHTAGVFGANQNGDYWAALGYMDPSFTGWGLYTPSGGYFGGRVGIGTASPDRPLEVNNPGGPAILGEVTYVGYQDYVGVEGLSVPADYYGIGGKFTGGYYGVIGQVSSTGGSSYTGVIGQTYGNGTKFGVYGYAFGNDVNYGVYGYGDGGTTNYAGYFVGNVHVMGTLSKAAGSFKIDHPLDPANKTLSHSFVESPDMMNVYNGNAVLGANGSAWVEMPAWFEALNRDFRYQLTAIGAPGPNLYIAEEMTGNRFQIAGGQAGMKVSWMVTGIRQDAYANANRIPVEEIKSSKDQGRYLNPEAFGMPESMAVGFDEQRAARQKGAN
ncbi:hypothetical protein FJ251_13250 [bacterium]|nr:hypothetical protein [bacterium]